LGNDHVLVIGGGAAGISAALGLASLGHPVSLVEKETQLGGQAFAYGCKATEECLLCGVCLLHDALREVKEEERIEVLTGANVEKIEGELGRFTVQVVVRQVHDSTELAEAHPESAPADRGADGAGERRELRAGAVVLAVGFEPFEASLKGEFGYGRYPHVITALDAERILKDKGKILKAGGGEPRRVAFIQCVGSRDVSLGKPYCSRICCAYALRMVAVLRHDFPECEVTVFYMDFQPLGKKFEMIRQGLEEDNKVRLLRTIPAKIYGWEGEKEVEVRYADPLTEGLVTEAFDLVILSIGLGGLAVSETVTGLKRTEDGFLEANGKAGRFLAGSCNGPRTIAESIADGRKVALQVAMTLRSRK